MSTQPRWKPTQHGSLVVEVVNLIGMFGVGSGYAAVLRLRNDMWRGPTRDFREDAERDATNLRAALPGPEQPAPQPSVHAEERRGEGGS